MKNKKMIVNTNLKMLDYVSIVDEIASEYMFNGEYQPHIGTLNAMRVFYNKCVVESKFDDKLSHDITDAADIMELVLDEEFIRVYNEALFFDGTIRLDFANAYKDAMDIVDSQKNSFGSVIQGIKSALEGVVDMLSPALSEENVSNIAKIAGDISNGKISAEALVDAYAKSQRFKDVVENNKSEIGKD